MDKQFFKKWLPNHHTIKTHPHLQFFFGTLLHDANLWHLNRRSLSGGIAVGLFCCFLPMPFQTVVSAMLAIWLRANLPLSVAAVWLTNPITIPPIFYFTYRLGCLMLGREPHLQTFSLSEKWLADTLSQIWLPLWLGSLTMGVLSALVSYYLVHYLWRNKIRRKWQDRLEKRRLQHQQAVKEAFHQQKN